MTVQHARFMQSKLKLLFVDGNSLGHTSHHVGDPRVVDGMQTQAVFNFLRSLHYKLSEDPELVPLVGWDGRAQFRFDIHPGYKGSRNRTEAQRADREAYTAQVPSLQKMLKHLGVAQVKAPLFETDDLGFQLSRLFVGTPHHLELYTGDTDWLQLVAENVAFRTVRKSGERVTLADFEEATGYATPQQFIEGKALKGDPADDIAGVPGIGEITAARILTEFGSLDGFYRHVEAGGAVLKRKAYKELALANNRALWQRNLELMDLSRAPRIDATTLQIAPGRLSEEAVERWCRDLQFHYYARNPDVLTKPFANAPDRKADILNLLNRL